jgi:enoyl-[acyl-carrier-protein] reductase (NADH)
LETTEELFDKIVAVNLRVGFRYLVSDLASFTTGACLTVDGGYSIGGQSG